MTSAKDKKAMEQLALLKDHKAQLVTLQKETTIDTLKAVEDKVLEDSIAIVQHCLNFADMGFDESGNPITPEAWEWLPLPEKEKRIRLAKATWMPSGDVPHGIKMAHATMLGIIKARAAQASGGNTLNIETAVFPAPAPLAGYNDLPIIEIESD